MPAAADSSRPTMASLTPLRIGSYALDVRDLDKVAAFYRRMIGLQETGRADGELRLGIAGVTLLHLVHRPDARPDDKASAGLFHTAFLMPTRGDLARWYAHARAAGLVIERAADHDVNIAIYYDDPEGNGCECYADRPPEDWKWLADGSVHIPSVPFDAEILLREAGAGEGAADTDNWRAPAGLRVGHINLRVGNVAAAEAFWRDGVGLDHTARERRPDRGTMTFLSSGGYHHHLAANDFTSRGAGARDPERAGLAWVAVEAASGAQLAATRARLQARGVEIAPIASGFEAQDPWGTRVRFVAAA